MYLHVLKIFKFHPPILTCVAEQINFIINTELFLAKIVVLPFLCLPKGHARILCYTAMVA